MKSPIILIPGVFGSKIVARHKYNGMNEICWVYPAVNAVSRLCKFMWGTYDQQKEEFISYMHEYADMTNVEGLTGCDKIVDHFLINGTNAAIVFQRLTEYLISVRGYKYEQDLFTFSYDWRNAMYSKGIMEKFHSLVLHINKTQNQKPILVGHSLGGLLVESYMRLYSDFNDHIKKFISLTTPFDGASAYCYLASLIGYNLQIPIGKTCAFKGFQLNNPNLALMASGMRKLYLPKLYIKRTKFKRNLTYELSSDNLDILEKSCFPCSSYKDMSKAALLRQ